MVRPALPAEYFLNRMQFAFLGSGSRGNALLVEHNNICVMVDNGFSTKETVSRLQRLQRSGDDIDAILVTHEHGDHVAGVGSFARRFKTPVWTTPGTYDAAAVRLGKLPTLHLFDPDNPFAIDDLEITPIPLIHDARQPCQFAISDGRSRVAVLTDTGRSSPAIEAVLSGCDALALECNHDKTMLQHSVYPELLKQRISGDRGHLDNVTAALILQAIDCRRLQHLVAVHLSEKNNTPEHARSALSQAIHWLPEDIEVATQGHGLSWRQIAHSL